VILAILDDLLFASKIRSAAAQAGVAITIARAKDGALADMRARVPALIIFDLNNPRTDPLGILSEMQTDPALRTIPTVGYVAHVDTATIDAARRAGIGEVLPRSAFTTKLPDIVARARSIDRR
jgi:PleD family two-component response regulator